MYSTASKPSGPVLFWIYDVQETSLETWVACFNSPCRLLRQVIRTVHPMCCVPSSVDTLSGLLLGWHAFFISVRGICHSFAIHGAERYNRASLHAALHYHAVAIYKQGPSLTSRTSAHDFMTCSCIVANCTPSLGCKKETLVSMYASGKALVTGPGRNGTSASATLHAAYTVMPRSTLVA